MPNQDQQNIKNNLPPVKGVILTKFIFGNLEVDQVKELEQQIEGKPKKEVVSNIKEAIKAGVFAEPAI